MRVVRSWWVRLFGRRPTDAELDAELRSHLEMDVEAQVQAGASSAKAQRDAKLRLGGVAATRERYLERATLPWVEGLLQDLRYAVRSVSRTPGFTVAAVATIALGVGVSTLVFSVANAVILNPFALPEPERLVFIERDSDLRIDFHPHPAFQEFALENDTFERMAGFMLMSGGVETDTGAGVTRLQAQYVTGDYFPLLGVQPALGRLLEPADDRPEAQLTAVLSHEFWQSAYQGDRAVLGKTVTVNQKKATIVGVSAAGFHGTEVTLHPQLWVPLHTSALSMSAEAMASPRARLLFVMGRLKPGVTRAAAKANLNAIAGEFARRYPNADQNYRVDVVSIGWLGDGFRSAVRNAMLGVFVLAGLVLLTACANVAMSLAARTADRAREMAIRMSLGSGRARVVRLLLLEGLLLTTVGAAFGIGVVIVSARALSDWTLPMEMPTRVEVPVDATVLLFAVTAAIVAGMLAVMAPARLLLGINPNASLKSGGGVIGGATWTIREGLAIAQVVLCAVLATACVVSLASAKRAAETPIGFKSDGLWAMVPDLGLAGRAGDQRRDYIVRLLDALKREPGVASVAYSWRLPLTGSQVLGPVFVEGLPTVGDGRMPPSVVQYNVSEDFFKTLQIPVIEGRAIEGRDLEGDPATMVVNQAFVRLLLQGRAPIGARVGGTASGPFVPIVGVVPDGKYESLTDVERPAVFLGIKPEWSAAPTILVRTTSARADILPRMRQAARRVDSRVPLFEVGSARDAMRIAFVPSELAARALTGLGVLTVALAIYGVYGVMSHAVIRRTREIGVRMAIGARARNVLKVVLGRVVVIFSIGLAVGIGLSLALGRVLDQVVYHASSGEPLVLAGVGIVMAAVALLATIGPVARALRISPVVALRAE
ncbi:MAG: ADOP family duplicated permease [Vicinamibacterales bacterium]